MTIQAAPDDGEHTDDAPELAVAEQFQPDIAEQAAGPAPVLITEREVLFCTAAALPPQPERRASWWIAALHRAFAASPSQPRRARKHYPRRSPGYLESSLISRDGHRL